MNTLDDAKKNKKKKNENKNKKPKLKYIERQICIYKYMYKIYEKEYEIWVMHTDNAWLHRQFALKMYKWNNTYMGRYLQYAAIVEER